MGPIFGLLKPALPIAMRAAAHPLSFCPFLIERGVREGTYLVCFAVLPISLSVAD